MGLSGSRIAITGVTGQVGNPVAHALAADNHVIGLARFADAEARAALESAGVECHVVNLVDPDLGDVPADVDYVLHFAVTKTGRWDKDLPANAESVGHLMSHFRNATAFLHCSTTAVYAPQGDHRLTELDPLGQDHHQHMMPTYSTVKTSAESVARFAAKEFELPTIVARLNVPYGDEGGWPAFHFMMLMADAPVPTHTDGGWYNPIHHEDIIEQLPAMLGAASVPATTLNWAGNDVVSIEEWCTFMGGLVGKEPSFEASDYQIPSAAIDTTAQHAVTGPCTVHWQDGFRRMVDSLT